MGTVVSRRSACGRALFAAVVGSLFLAAAACAGGGGGDGTPTDYGVVGGTQLCGGDAVSADASKALKVITGASRFEASAERYTVAKSASDLIEAYPVPTLTQDVCRVYNPLGTPDFELRITWNLEDRAPTAASAPNFTELDMGERAVAAEDKAYVFFGCKSVKLGNSRSAAHIVVGVERWGMPKPPEGDPEALKDAYATVAHSVSLAMARELRCEDSGGLPARPVLDPA
ncbi:hypothetical protein [Streptomyces pacificus]|uniref:Lipoprotein n=1 Tax=Streptomyces pacificus TaxID=2705029 RepID=A0A6A0AZY7_9ACTN|nr:hypothetical protein [Streptomyces pacificus]GFH37901.1 hypothetical protein SCWH03_41410 [Streptomyces pacificus]